MKGGIYDLQFDIQMIQGLNLMYVIRQGHWG